MSDIFRIGLALFVFFILAGPEKAFAVSPPPPQFFKEEVVTRNKQYVAVGRIPSQSGTIGRIRIHRTTGDRRPPKPGKLLWSIKLRNIERFFPTETGDGLIVITNPWFNRSGSRSWNSASEIKRAGVVVYRLTDAGVVRRNYSVRDLSKRLLFGFWLKAVKERPRSIAVYGYRKKTRFSRITGLPRRRG